MIATGLGMSERSEDLIRRLKPGQMPDPKSIYETFVPLSDLLKRQE
jgi:hypothetical protein